MYFFVTYPRGLESGSPDVWTRYANPMLVTGIIAGIAMATILFVGARPSGAERRHRSWWWLTLPVVGLLAQAASSIYIVVVLVSFVFLVGGLLGVARLDPLRTAAARM